MGIPEGENITVMALHFVDNWARRKRTMFSLNYLIIDKAFLSYVKLIAQVEILATKLFNKEKLQEKTLFSLHFIVWI